MYFSYGYLEKVFCKLKTQTYLDYFVSNFPMYLEKVCQIYVIELLFTFSCVSRKKNGCDSWKSLCFWTSCPLTYKVITCSQVGVYEGHDNAYPGSQRISQSTHGFLVFPRLWMLCCCLIWTVFSALSRWVASSKICVNDLNTQILSYLTAMICVQKHYRTSYFL